MNFYSNIRLSLIRIQAIVHKEILQLSRDRITFAMIVMLPFIQLLLFGYAINTNVRDIQVGVVDQSQNVFSREIIKELQASQVVKFISSYPTPQQGEVAITKGQVHAVLFLPKDLSYRLAHNDKLGQWLVDGSDTAISSALLQLQNIPINANETEHIRDNTRFEIDLFFNPERNSATNIVPD